MRLAYHRIFRRCGLEAFGVDADAGDIGGSGSMEFMLAADVGEDSILLESSSGYAANVEKAVSRFAAPVAEDPKPIRIEDTPGIRTCDELTEFFPDVAKDRMVKTILFKAVHADQDQLWAALIRGDQEVNETKLGNHAGGLDLKMLTADEIREHTGAEQGFAGPIDLPETFELVADETVRGMSNLLCGVNQTDKHALDVHIGRDFPEPTYADFRLAREGEPGPRNGDPLELRRGIEVGHIFKLGSVYSEPMGATFMDQNGRAKPFVMGCYGIGVSRTAAAAVEQFADDKGIVWPVPIAPFEVAVGFLTKKNTETIAAAEACYEQLKARGIEVLLDDRKMSPGAKMKDLEIIGFPYAVLFGRTFEQEGMVELRTRLGNTSVNLAPEAVVDQIVAWVEEARRGNLTD
jgi:prolyl-tRNA synthetase